MIVRFAVELDNKLIFTAVKIQFIIAFIGSLILLPLSLLATPLEPEFYDPREYINLRLKCNQVVTLCRVQSCSGVHLYTIYPQHMKKRRILYPYSHTYIPNP